MAALLILAAVSISIVAISAWRAYVEAGRMLDEMRDMLGDPR